MSFDSVLIECKFLSVCYTELFVGNDGHFRGDVTTEVKSVEMNHESLPEAGPGDSVPFMKDLARKCDV